MLHYRLALFKGWIQETIFLYFFSRLNLIWFSRKSLDNIHPRGIVHILYIFQILQSLKLRNYQLHISSSYITFISRKRKEKLHWCFYSYGWRQFYFYRYRYFQYILIQISPVLFITSNTEDHIFLASMHHI